MTILTSLSEALPIGYKLTHLILLDPEWQANLSSDEGVAIGTGETIEAAITRASENAEIGKLCGRFILHELRAPEPKSLLERLGLRRTTIPQIARRV